MNNLLEQLASHEHERWAHWQKYLNENYTQKDGSLVIPKEKVEHWNRQIHTKYKDLSEREKEADRMFARKIVEIIKENAKGI